MNTSQKLCGLTPFRRKQEVVVDNANESAGSARSLASGWEARENCGTELPLERAKVTTAEEAREHRALRNAALLQEVAHESCLGVGDAATCRQSATKPLGLGQDDHVPSNELLDKTQRVGLGDVGVGHAVNEDAWSVSAFMLDPRLCKVQKVRLRSSRQDLRMVGDCQPGVAANTAFLSLRHVIGEGKSRVLEQNVALVPPERRGSTAAAGTAPRRLATAGRGNTSTS